MKRLIALLLLLPSITFGAQDFDGSTGYAESSTVEVSAAPLTICAWFNSDSQTTFQSIVGPSRSATSFESFSLTAHGNTAGDPVQFNVTNAGSAVTAASSSGYTAGTWHLGCAVETSTTSRAAFIDGGSKGTNTDSKTPVSLDRMNVGSRWVGSGPTHSINFNGRIAEIGIWNAALTDAEVATLSKGFAPPCVRRASLISYYPMVRDTTSLKDLFSATANNLTLNGTNDVADHVRVINCQ